MVDNKTLHFMVFGVMYEICGNRVLIVFILKKESNITFDN